MRVRSAARRIATLGAEQDSRHCTGMLEQAIERAPEIVIAHLLAAAFGRFESSLAQELLEERSSHALRAVRHAI